MERRIEDLIIRKNHPKLLILPFSGNFPDEHRKPNLPSNSGRVGEKKKKPISKQVNTYSLFSFHSVLYFITAERYV